MADTDLLPSRGVPFEALVDSTGIAINGSSTVGHWPPRRMYGPGNCRKRRAVHRNRHHRRQPSWRQQNRSRRYPGVLREIDQNGVAQNASTADQLRSRGIRPRVLLDATGVALNGSAGQAVLAVARADVVLPGG